MIEPEIYPVPTAHFNPERDGASLRGMEEYKKLYKESLDDPNAFWARLSRELLTFDQDFHTFREGTPLQGDISWFLGGRLNATYNCVDRHAKVNPDRNAIVYEADEPNQGRTVTYGELLAQVSSTASALRALGVKKGDRVVVYMPMIPEAFIAVLAISRLGAIHTLIFDGFSPSSIADRILNAEAEIVVTVDQARRSGRETPMKKGVDEALARCPNVRTVLVYQHCKSPVPWTEGRDVWWHEAVKPDAELVEPEIMDSEDPLFILYTSGSTGKPKGLVHSTAGFLTGAAATGKYVFDIQPSDTFFCAGDIGWITGLVYGFYAPLLLGCTTVIFEGSPLYPTPLRYWEICEKHDVTQFYVAPTALRLLKRFSDSEISQSLSSLRVLGSIGEPIAPEVWKWYHQAVGKGKAHVLDTYFQTETGSLVLTPLAGVTPTKPGSCTLPFFGADPVVLDSVTGKEIESPCPEGILAFRNPWPSMARSAWGDPERFLDTYFRPYPGYYFTGDGARKDSDGYYWIKGRIDDVVNVSGHRLSTAEIEAALLENEYVAEVAVVGVDDEITGQSVIAFVTLKQQPEGRDIRKDLKKQITRSIGSLALPRTIHLVSDIPKTRSGKITRRILRKILSDDMENIGDTSTVVNPAAIDIVAGVVLGLKK
ncbi:Acetate--CoA ligase [Penicillium brevicompactum]|uniref:Acetyl-coenzyme A synthetase n=1 Tax=Penicillium brevicompactum TaxID=5074 RepID=A0A9W9UK86_PENBR|nr:Acetate--CoA ligase [Penicillium brevicompactum]